MEAFDRRLVLVAIATALTLSSTAGCGTRTPLDLGRDGSISPSIDGGMRLDGGECRRDAECNDGLACNGVESCVSGRCIIGPPIACDDGISCTIDQCTEPGGCFNRPDDALCPGGSFCDPRLGCRGLPCGSDLECNDGLACNGDETCGPEGTCRAGEPLRCDDGVDCTIDLCDEPGACGHLPDPARCPSGACHPMLGCLDTMCGSALDCDDGRACNGSEQCVSGRCRPGSPLACLDDGIACTVETCSEIAGGCSTTLDSSLCPAGQLCEPMVGCVERRCMPGTICDDGFSCNGIETCDAAGRCVAGPRPDCNDGESCTVDRCIESFGCISEPRASRDICGNGTDDDCDGSVDCLDVDCRGAPGCPTCTPISMSEFSCFDGRDDDCDDAVDCDDFDCRGVPGCGPIGIDAGPPPWDAGPPRDAGPPPRDSGPPRDTGPPRDGGVTNELGIPACTNGIDDDGDGRADCRDPDCSPLGMTGECCNGIDDDGDGSTDIFTCRCFDDSTCVGVGDLDQVCWEASFSLCAPRCNFYGGNAFCQMYLPELPRCNAATGECVP